MGNKLFTCSLHEYSGLNAPCPRCGLIGRLDKVQTKEPSDNKGMWIVDPVLTNLVESFDGKEFCLTDLRKLLSALRATSLAGTIFKWQDGAILSTFRKPKQ